MKLIFLILALFASINSYSQTVGRNSCKIFLESYDPIEDNGELAFEIDCRMVDCLLELEISNDERRKKRVFQYWIYARNYYMTEDSTIIMKMNLGQMKSLMENYQSILMTVTIYSMTADPVFRRLMPFDKNNLIRTYQLRKE